MARRGARRALRRAKPAEDAPPTSLALGIVGIDEGAFAAEAAHFGGGNESRYGREGSVHGLDDPLHLKSLCQGGLG